MTTQPYCWTVRGRLPSNNPCVFDASNYFVDVSGARVVLNAGSVPPVPGRAVGGIDVLFTAGFGDAESDVPGALRQGIKQLAASIHQDTHARRSRPPKRLQVHPHY